MPQDPNSAPDTRVEGLLTRARSKQHQVKADSSSNKLLESRKRVKFDISVHGKDTQPRIDLNAHTSKKNQKEDSHRFKVTELDSSNDNAAISNKRKNNQKLSKAAVVNQNVKFAFQPKSTWEMRPDKDTASSQTTKERGKNDNAQKYRNNGSSPDSPDATAAQDTRPKPRPKAKNSIKQSIDLPIKDFFDLSRQPKLKNMKATEHPIPDNSEETKKNISKDIQPDFETIIGDTSDHELPVDTKTSYVFARLRGEGNPTVDSMLQYTGKLATAPKDSPEIDDVMVRMRPKSSSRWYMVPAQYKAPPFLLKQSLSAALPPQKADAGAETSTSDDVPLTIPRTSTRSKTTAIPKGPPGDTKIKNHEGIDSENNNTCEVSNVSGNGRRHVDELRENCKEHVAGSDEEKLEKDGASTYSGSDYSQTRWDDKRYRKNDKYMDTEEEDDDDEDFVDHEDSHSHSTSRQAHHRAASPAHANNNDWNSPPHSPLSHVHLKHRGNSQSPKGKGRQTTPSEVEGEDDPVAHKTGRYPKLDMKRISEFGDRVIAEADELAKSIGRSREQVMKIACLDIAMGRRSNPWTIFKRWYSIFHQQLNKSDSTEQYFAVNKLSKGEKIDNLNEWNSECREAYIKHYKNKDAAAQETFLQNMEKDLDDLEPVPLLSRMRMATTQLQQLAQGLYRRRDLVVAGVIISTGNDRVSIQESQVFSGSPELRKIIFENQLEVGQFIDYLTAVIKTKSSNGLRDMFKTLKEKIPKSVESDDADTQTSETEETTVDKKRVYSNRDKIRSIISENACQFFSRNLNFVFNPKRMKWGIIALLLHERKVLLRGWPTDVPPPSKGFKVTNVSSSRVKDFARLFIPETPNAVTIEPWSGAAAAIENTSTAYLEIPLIVSREGQVLLTVHNIIDRVFVPATNQIPKKRKRSVSRPPDANDISGHSKSKIVGEEIADDHSPRPREPLSSQNSIAEEHITVKPMPKRRHLGTPEVNTNATPMPPKSALKRKRAQEAGQESGEVVNESHNLIHSGPPSMHCDPELDRRNLNPEHLETHTFVGKDRPPISRNPNGRGEYEEHRADPPALKWKRAQDSGEGIDGSQYPIHRSGPSSMYLYTELDRRIPNPEPSEPHIFVDEDRPFPRNHVGRGEYEERHPDPRRQFYEPRQSHQAYDHFATRSLEDPRGNYYNADEIYKHKQLRLTSPQPAWYDHGPIPSSSRTDLGMRYDHADAESTRYQYQARMANNRYDMQPSHYTDAREFRRYPSETARDPDHNRFGFQNRR